MMTISEVEQAIRNGGSIRKAAILLGKSATTLQWWLARNGYKVVKQAILVPIHPETPNQVVKPATDDTSKT